MSEQKLELEDIPVLRWPDSLHSSPVHLLIKTGLGMTFVLATMCPPHTAQGENSHRFHTVHQQECHSEHRNDKIPELASPVRRCKSCDQCKDQSAFASKGRDRPSALCKDCDNERRRSSYSPKVMAPDWSHLAVNFEVMQTDDQSQLAPLIWEMLVDQKIVRDGATDFKEETLDSLLNRRSAIDGIIEGGST